MRKIQPVQGLLFGEKKKTEKINFNPIMVVVLGNLSELIVDQLRKKWSEEEGGLMTLTTRYNY